MDVRRNGDAGVKFSQDGDTLSFLVLVEDQEFDARIGAGLPFFSRASAVY